MVAKLPTKCDKIELSAFVIIKFNCQKKSSGAVDYIYNEWASSKEFHVKRDDDFVTPVTEQVAYDHCISPHLPHSITIALPP